MRSKYKENNRGDNGQPCLTPNKMRNSGRVPNKSSEIVANRSQYSNYIAFTKLGGSAKDSRRTDQSLSRGIES